MGREVKFMTVINNHRNWPDNIDFEGIDENTIKLKDMLDKMYFEEYPRHAEVFVLMFGDQEFIDTLIGAMVKLGITHLNKLWFRECSEKDKKILIEKGIISEFSLLPGITNVALMRNEQDCFVNVIL